MAARWAVAAGECEGTGRSGALVSEGLVCLFRPHCAASLQAAPGCAGSLAGRGRRGESGSAGVLEEACPAAAPGAGGRAAPLRRPRGLEARVADLGLLAGSHPALELWGTGRSVLMSLPVLGECDTMVFLS